MTAEVAIRPYAEADIDAVIALMRDLAASELEIYGRTRPPEAWHAGDIADFKNEIQKSRGEMLVAELDGAIVGYCNLHTHRDTQNDQDEIFYEYAHIGDLSVAAQYRSRGIGQQMMNHCEHIVRSAGIKWLRLNVLAANNRGRKFYADRGYKESLVTLEKAL